MGSLVVVVVWLLSFVRLFCSPMECSTLASSVHRISQARILEWVAFPSLENLPDPGTELTSPALAGDSLPLITILMSMGFLLKQVF